MVLVVAFCYLGHPKNLLTEWLIDWLKIFYGQRWLRPSRKIDPYAKNMVTKAFMK